MNVLVEEALWRIAEEVAGMERPGSSMKWLAPRHKDTSYFERLVLLTPNRNAFMLF